MCVCKFLNSRSVFHSIEKRKKKTENNNALALIKVTPVRIRFRYYYENGNNERRLDNRFNEFSRRTLIRVCMKASMCVRFVQKRNFITSYFDHSDYFDDLVTFREIP